MQARPRLLAQLVAAAVAGAGSAAVVTVKFRTGISDAIQTFLEVHNAAAGKLSRSSEIWKTGCLAAGTTQLACQQTVMMLPSRQPASETTINRSPCIAPREVQPQ